MASSVFPWVCRSRKGTYNMTFADDASDDATLDSALKTVRVQSMVASKTLTPAVMLRVQDSFVTISVTDARAIGAQLLTAAAQSISDAALLRMILGTGRPLV